MHIKLNCISRVSEIEIFLMLTLFYKISTSIDTLMCRFDTNKWYHVMVINDDFLK